MTDKEKIISAIAAVVLLGGTAWYIYDQGKKKGMPVPLPFDTNAQGTTTNQASDMRNIEVIADRMYQGDKGLNIPFFKEHDEEAYSLALTLSNTDFTELYNVWNTKYKPTEDMTMTQFILSQDAANDSTYGTLRQSVLNKLASLNLM